MPRTIRGDAPKASQRKTVKAEDAFGNREEWLTEAARLIVEKFRHVFIEHFGPDGVQHLSKVRASTGFPSRGGERGIVIGQCWTSKTSKDGSHHIFISPLLEDPVRVVATLAHEMVHAADDGASKHRGKFTRAVRGMGLKGKPTATFAGTEFSRWVKTEVLEVLGKYPHVALKPTIKVPAQKTYQLLIECPACGCKVRMTQKWLDEAGAPFCGTRSHMIDGERTDKRIRMEAV